MVSEMGLEIVNFKFLEAWECYSNVEAVQDIGISGYVPKHVCFASITY